MDIYPGNSLKIHKANNGFIVNAKGTRAEQEDKLDGVHVFEDISGLIKFIEKHYDVKDQRTENVNQ